MVAEAKNRALPIAEVAFDYKEHEGKITILEAWRGQSGWLTLSLATVESLDQAEDQLIFAMTTDSGAAVDEDTAMRLLSLPGSVTGTPSEHPPTEPHAKLTRESQTAMQRAISERNAGFFEAEADKLDGWADDLKLGLEREIKDLDRQIKETRRAATTALMLEEKLAGQKQIRSLESQRNERRRSLFDAQDQVDKQRDSLIASIEGKLIQKTELRHLFTIHWRLR